MHENALVKEKLELREYNTNAFKSRFRLLLSILKNNLLHMPFLVVVHKIQF